MPRSPDTTQRPLSFALRGFFVASAPGSAATPGFLLAARVRLPLLPPPLFHAWANVVKQPARIEMIENETGVFDYRHPHPEPTTVYRDSLTGALYLDKLSEVAAYSVRWRALEGLSLDADRSADLLATIAKEM